MSCNIILNKFPLVTPIDFLIRTSNTEKHIIAVSKTMHQYIQQLKQLINNDEDEWDKVKKFVNPYEFIHTKVPGTYTSVCKYVPISRSFFKLIEIFDSLKLDLFSSANIQSLHLAEAPGGFIEALNFYCKYTNTYISRSVGISLSHNKPHTPNWNHAFLRKLPFVHLEAGLNRGDLTNTENFIYMLDKYPPLFDIITADGGFDFSSDFNQQEVLSQPLIIAEIFYAIAFQKSGGTFILKMFDCFTKLSCELIYILTSLYENTYIIKPNTSRAANSEKYIICRNYINTPHNRKQIIQLIPHILESCHDISSILEGSLPLCFINRLEEINSMLGQQQLESIFTTISIIETPDNKDKLFSLKTQHVQKCINWCVKHKFSFHKNLDRIHT
tara:strand:+ start:854 stop:2011 length:1158 start_codon:yes stop_codon:yes gene_type:complete